MEQLQIDPESGRSLKAVYATAGGYALWFADDGKLPVVKHVLASDKRIDR